MALPKIKTAEEQKRLDAIFAEIEAAERGKLNVPLTSNSEQEAESNRRNKIDKLANLEIKEFLGNVKANIRNNAYNTKWEKIMSQFIVNTIPSLNAELNILRNFANAVDKRLESAERSAREQDNHHYYKIFAEGVKKLLESI